MVSEEELQQRIAEEQAKIEVPSYQDATWDSAWKRRASAIWGIGAVGMTVGAVIGLLAPVLPALVASAPFSAAVVAKSVAIFASLGITGGMGIGMMAGPAAGSAAGAIKEFERRQIAREIEQKIRDNPDADVTLLQERVSQLEEDNPKSIRFADYFNVKTGLLFAAIGAVGGLIFATALLATGGLVAAGGVAASPMIAQLAMPAAQLLLGSAAGNAAAVTAYSVGLGALFGMNFGVSHALITRQACNFAGDLLSGRGLGSPWPKRVNLPEPKPVLSPVVVTRVSEPEQAESKTFSEREKRAPNYEALVNQSIREADAQLTR